ncbi:hypothetical protein AAEX28_06730 [Lentisphaerota bacterium WC36G]|nr:hypothetical protein LJT99_09595 [Lentisphaerae bacterium WC36]UDQ98396.1 hypothetical protein LJT99_02415 [Lentisphaerae bacterium WC36]
MKKKLIITLLFLFILIYGNIWFFGEIRKLSSPRVKSITVDNITAVKIFEKKYIALEVSSFHDSMDQINLYGISNHKNKIIIANIMDGLLSKVNSNLCFNFPKLVLIPLEELDEGITKVETMNYPTPSLLFSILKKGNNFEIINYNRERVTIKEK